MSKRSHVITKVFAQSAVLPIFMAPIAQAQVLEEIVVTAQRRAQDIQDVPLSVTTFSGDQLKDLRIINTDDVVDFTPGLTMFSPLGEGNTPNFALRGVSGSDITTTTEAPIAVYWDEIYYGTQFGAIGLVFDMERFEALRGPQGTLYGHNVTGGLLHFVTRKPEIGETSGYVDLAVGSNAERTVEGVANVALGRAWAMRMAVAAEQYDGYVHNRFPGQPNPNDTDKIAGRVQFGYEGGRSRLNINLHSSEDDSRVGSWQIVGAEVLDALGNVIVPAQNSLGESIIGTSGRALLFDPGDVDPVTTELLNPMNLSGDAFIAFAESIAVQGYDTRRAPDKPINFGLFGGPYIDSDGDPFAGSYNYIADLNIENTGGSIRYEYDISNSMTVVALAATEEFRQRYLEDTDLSPVDDIRAFFSGTNKQNSAEFRLEGSTNRIPSYVLGLYKYDRDVIDDAGPNVILPTLIENVGINPQIQRDSDGHTNSLAIFGHAEISLGDKLILNAGLRYTDEETTLTTGSGHVDFCLFANVDPVACAAARQNAFLFGAPLSSQGVSIDLERFQTTLPTQANSFAPLTFPPDGLPENYVEPDYQVTRDRLSDNFSTGVLKLIYYLKDRNMVYASYAQGSKSGGFNQDPTAVAILGTNVFGAEKLDSLEFGYRGEFADGRMRLNATVFDYDYRDFQANQIIAPGLSGTINTDAAISGGELDISWAPGRNWRLFLSSAFLFDTEVSNITDELGITRSREMKQAPDLQLNGFVETAFPVWGGDLKVQLNLMYTDEYFSFLNNLGGGLVPSFRKLGASVGWTGPSDRWYWRVNVMNLTDEEILISAYDFSASEAYVQALYEPPRWTTLSFGVRL